MPPLVALAHEFGGRVQSGAILVPAGRLAEFLAAARERDVEVPYVDCLYLGQGFTEPSMELSGAPTDFSTWNNFLSFAMEAAEKAQSRARSGEDRAIADSAEAFFQVGP